MCLGTREVCSTPRDSRAPGAGPSSSRNSEGQCVSERGEQGTLVRLKGGQVTSNLYCYLASSELDSKVESGRLSGREYLSDGDLCGGGGQRQRSNCSAGPTTRGP